MSQAGTRLRRAETGYYHWCPGCEMMHPLPDRWTFNGDVERPTFSPSFLHRFGKDDARVCHYILTDGVLNYCSDSTHALAGKAVPLPTLADVDADEWDWI